MIKAGMYGYQIANNANASSILGATSLEHGMHAYAMQLNYYIQYHPKIVLGTT